MPHLTYRWSKYKHISTDSMYKLVTSEPFVFHSAYKAFFGSICPTKLHDMRLQRVGKKYKTWNLKRSCAKLIVVRKQCDEQVWFYITVYQCGPDVPLRDRHLNGDGYVPEKILEIVTALKGQPYYDAFTKGAKRN